MNIVDLSNHKQIFFLGKKDKYIKENKRYRDWGDIKPDPVTTKTEIHRENTNWVDQP
jgi:hypothetical protein